MVRHGRWDREPYRLKDVWPELQCQWMQDRADFLFRLMQWHGCLSYESPRPLELPGWSSP